MMDRAVRKRHHSPKLSDELEDKKNISPLKKTSSQSLSKLEENDTKYAISSVPNSEPVDSNCDFDSLVSSTCSSGDYYECPGELSDAYKTKIGIIQAALQDPVDRDSLRSLARSEGGLINDVIRRRVWPELLGIGNKESTFSATDDDIENHKEFHQVILDVNRSLKRFPPGISNSERIILQDQLTKLILSVIVKHPFLCYYQGYHDVAVTLLLVVGDEKDHEDREEKSGASGRGFVGGDAAVENEADVSESLGKEGIHEKAPPSLSETQCNEGNEQKTTLVPDEKQINGEETKCIETEEENLSRKDGIARNGVTARKDQSSMAHAVEASEEEGEGHSRQEPIRIETLNRVETGGEDDVDNGRDNVMSVSGSYWDCWHDETESVDKPARGNLISMWCSDVALKMLEHLSLHHFRGCMEPTMDATSRLLHHVFPIVARKDHELCAFLDRSGVGTVYCLPWILTWYGHSLSNHDIVVRLYDYFLASPVAAPLYLAASIILYRRKEILETECDMAAVHGLLSQIPDDLPFELLLSKASALYEVYPPEILQEDVEERSAREFQAREERSSRLGAGRISQATSNSAIIPWTLLAMLPPHYVNRFVPWFWLTRGRMRWLRAWARMIPMRHINGRYVLAALPFAMYYAYSHLASNTGS